MEKMEIVKGQRFASEAEPELGLGKVLEVDRYRVQLVFPVSGEQRIFAAGAEVLKRVVLRAGDRMASEDGVEFTVEEVEENEGLLTYRGAGMEVREDTMISVSGVSRPLDRLFAGRVDDGKVFDLRCRTLKLRQQILSSELRGFLGARVELIPHQFYLLSRVAPRQFPRVLLSDEVGLGKTIEACLILQRLRAVGRAERVLILVPEPLIHQWFVELLRRFNLWFSLYDESRCRALEAGEGEGNPFGEAQLVLCATEFLAENENRAAQALSGGWDLVIVDEAHHLKWSQNEVSREYRLVEALGKKSRGLLLLTATPTQLGLDGHFARLRLLDPERYSDLRRFETEAKDFEKVAGIAGKVLEDKRLNAKDRKELVRIFHRDTEGLQERLDALDRGESGASSTLLNALLDEYGTGRVIFRNTRANITGFPQRVFCPVALEVGDHATLLSRLARELKAEAEDAEGEIRYQFKDDPRTEWLVDFIREHRALKILLICKSRRKVTALEAALKEQINVRMALFHEDLTLIQRDRNAAWFVEEDGAQLLICSEIGSEGRNFQFAHHLVLFDLPLNPGLLEQRIGRLDRIGQKHPIQIHVPYVSGSPQEFVADWYHRGLNAFEECIQGGMEYHQRFGEELIGTALRFGKTAGANRDRSESLIVETARFREGLEASLREGRDRLLELNSFNPDAARLLIERIQAAEKDEAWRETLFQLFDHFGVRIEEYEGGVVRLDPGHAYVEGFPSIPRDGSLATFDRLQAIAREDMMFLTADHSLTTDTIDLLLNGERGTVAFSIRESDEPNLLLEAVFLLEVVAPPELHLGRFMAPDPIRVLVDVQGNDCRDAIQLLSDPVKVRDGDVHRFLEHPGSNRGVIEMILDRAETLAIDEMNEIKKVAMMDARERLGEELERLERLSVVNPNVGAKEVESARREMEKILKALAGGRLRLDSVRVVVEGAVAGLARMGEV